MNIRIILCVLLSVVVLSVFCTEDQDYSDFMQTENKDSEMNPSDGSKEKDYNTNSLICIYANNSMPHQSGALFGDYLLLVKKSYTRLCLYNMKQKKLLFDIKLEPEVGTTYYGKDMYHCNQTTFGADFYDSSDPFPLLYISQRAKSDKRCFTEVFRILPQKIEENGEYMSMELQLVQTIYFPPMTEANSLGNVNSVIDSDNRLLYTYSRNNVKTDSNYRQCKISCFDIPNTHQEVVYLEDSDIKLSFMLDISAYYMQGACIEGDYLYIARGAPSVGYIDINIINLNKQKIVKQLDLLHNGYGWEPEGCFFYNGHLMIGAGKNIWELLYPNLN